ncbi:probable inactive poly [ADP-ribose] polymerase SRO2 [Macadamia integrifolia]|uniref:probable inactive poly [ADP-ribose] polymerase SRO2 n=1 Tax=Macadamia integrifolia TaxID=60698 RepID=UPI001C4F8AB2|nr:probable inactive poly [ADP-ribose] polymerase SRO2 [Macadamia integrifolia]
MNTSVAVMKTNDTKCQISPPPVGRNGRIKLRSRDLVSDHCRRRRNIEHMKHRDNGDSASDTTNERDISVSDSESVVSGSTTAPEFESFTGNGLIRLEEGDNEHDIIKNRFILGLGSLGRHATVVAVHKNSFSSFHRQARFQSFKIFSEAMSLKCNGNANIKYAWYGTSRERVHRTVHKNSFSSFHRRALHA